MHILRLSRSLHKWLALLVGAQLFLWTLSGFYMVVVDLDVIHGDMLVQNMQQTLDPKEQMPLPVSAILARFPQATGVTLEPQMGKSIYLVRTDDSVHRVDAVTGTVLTPLDRAMAVSLAEYHYSGLGAVARAVLLDDDLPGEVRFASAPLWRVDFDDRWGSTFYVDPLSGHLLARRHTLWRIFDFLWMLHIMDYEEREDVNNSLLRGLSFLAVIFVLSGGWLLFCTFSHNRKGSAL